MSKKLKVVYVAGPFTAPNVWQRELNIRAAENVAMMVAEIGAMPLCPHSNTRHFEGTISLEFWYEGTLELLRRCDAMQVVPGWQRSTGTKREIEEAELLKLPTFYNGADLAEWLRKVST